MKDEEGKGPVKSQQFQKSQDSSGGNRPGGAAP